MDFGLDLPTDIVLSSLGASYNQTVRVWMMMQARAQIDHHEKIVNHYKDLLAKLEGLDIQELPEPVLSPRPPLTPSGAQPLKLADLAKQNAARVASTPRVQRTKESSDSSKKSEKKDKKDKNSSDVNPSVKVKLASKPKSIKPVTDSAEQGAADMVHFSKPQAKKSSKPTKSLKFDEADAAMVTKMISIASRLSISSRLPLPAMLNESSAYKDYSSTPMSLPPPVPSSGAGSIPLAAPPSRPPPAISPTLSAPPLPPQSSSTTKGPPGPPPIPSSVGPPPLPKLS